MLLELALLYAGAGLVLAAAALAVVRLLREDAARNDAARAGVRRWPEIVLALSLAAVLAFLVARGWRTRTFPATDLGESLAVFTLALGACYLALVRSTASTKQPASNGPASFREPPFRNGGSDRALTGAPLQRAIIGRRLLGTPLVNEEEGLSLGAFVLPAAASLAVAAAVVVTLSYLEGEGRPREFHGFFLLFLVVHTTSSFAAYAAFAFGCGASVAYLMQERALRSKKLGVLFRKLPSLSALDAMSLRSVELGFPLLTVGIATGAAWAYREWGSFLRWEPKITLALLLWLLTAAVFHMRAIEKREGHRTAILMVASGVMVLAVFLGAMLIPGGRHVFL